jgi:hypothetical protein
MTSRERALLALAIVGFLVPNAMVTMFFIDHGLDVSGYFSHWGESLPAAHRQGEILLVLELVIEGAARIARLARHLFEHEVAVAVAGEAPRGRLEQRAPRAGAPLGLG